MGISDNELERQQAPLSDAELAQVADEVGETHELRAALPWPPLCLSNGGGAKFTSRFLHSRLPGHTILWPFGKPEGWRDCRDYAWQGRKPGSPSVDQLAAALPLPEETPAEPLPAELVPSAPPARDTRDAFADAMAAMAVRIPGLTFQHAHLMRPSQEAAQAAPAALGPAAGVLGAMGGTVSSTHSEYL
ncbi:hypothetical protein ABPG75_004336 [Micractinium tetrahymenae]